MKNKYLMLILILVIILVSNSIVSADMGPKPTANIHVTLNEQNVLDSSFNAKMLTCVSAEFYYDKEVIPQLNISEYDSARNCYWRPYFLAWGGDCKNSECYFHYFLPEEFRLAIYLPSQDKLYSSSEVYRHSFYSTYNANLLPDGSINLRETTSLLSRGRFPSFLRALVITLILELLVAFIYLSIKKITKRILIYVLIGNIISLPLVWFFFPIIDTNPILMLIIFIISEIFAIVFEAFFINYFNKDTITLKNSFSLSVIMNSVSLLIGGFVFGFVMLIGL